MKYQLLKNTPDGTSPNTVRRLSDGAAIPFDSSNRDYQEYLKWLDGYELVGMEWVKTSEGNEALPADEPS